MCLEVFRSKGRGTKNFSLNGVGTVIKGRTDGML